MSKTIRHYLDWASDKLSSMSCSARLDSEVLLAHCLKKNRSYLMTWPEQELSNEQAERYLQLIQRRLQPQPVAYLVESREFYSMELKTTPATLVPRPETELLVDTVLELIESTPATHILELGTGSGAIALALKKHARDIHVLATDNNTETLAVAKENAHKHQLDVDFLLSDWYSAITPARRYDVIVSNPPYIAADDAYLHQGDLPAEPLQALSCGESGLEAIEIIVQQCHNHLRPKGWLALEHGFEQGAMVRALFAHAGFQSIKTLKDFNHLPRVTYAQFVEANNH